MRHQQQTVILLKIELFMLSFRDSITMFPLQDPACWRESLTGLSTVLVLHPARMLKIRATVRLCWQCAIIKKLTTPVDGAPAAAQKKTLATLVSGSECLNLPGCTFYGYFPYTPIYLHKSVKMMTNRNDKHCSTTCWLCRPLCWLSGFVCWVLFVTLHMTWS